MHPPKTDGSSQAGKGPLIRLLDGLEWLGNKLPDPAILFLMGLAVVWLLSAVLASAGVEFTIPGKAEPEKIQNLLTSTSLATFLSEMVKTFVEFHPLGVVLVALLGVGIAEHAGFINATLKSLLVITPKSLLTPMLIFVALISHTAADAGYVLVIPIGGVMFYAAGRHPLAGIAAAFAGVSGGFSANILVSGIDPLLAGLTASGTGILAKPIPVSPLCNFYFTASSSVLIIVVGWLVTEWIVEPKLKSTVIDGDPQDMPKMVELTDSDRKAMRCAFAILAAMLVGLIWWAWPNNSALRNAEGKLMASDGALMKGIVPLIFFFFAVPGIVHGYLSGKFRSHRDVIKAMAKSMETMGYYLVLVFFVALFIQSFGKSKIGSWLAVSGAQQLQELGAGPVSVVTGIVLLTALVNLLVGSASAKWAMLSPIFVPMLMMMGISPEMTQAAYRVGDSTTNIITPLMPYFPLVVVFCQKYSKQTGIGTVAAMMLPYSLCFLVCWTIYLILYWKLGIPLGPGSVYEYSPIAVESGVAP